ncbi:TlpA family protein disulfide reductase [Pseudonocardia xinjiangensis]|uniref:TlpA family protein disulfide reductase n=1 Tax=Pseudonocardia xinjiangensis TaxID=75289 RepID=A0ABX1RPL0_9PSEU|nr:TlpA disulfide reductase family protein [Pseudonocardia xinjiangensis]NMH82317.1 TlpA family protein disulfide reductase [Pseudonocardia xinjiangensis]
MRRIWIAVGVALLLLLAGCAGTKDAVAQTGNFEFVAPGGKTTIFYDPPASRGKAAGISGDSLLHEGTTVGLDDYAGKVVVLNIWGSWCGPCRAEMPQLQSVQEQTGAAVLGIDVRDDRDAATDFVRDRGVTFDSIFDAPGRTLAALRGYPRNTVPSTLVLDRQHRVAAVYLTTVRVSELAPVIQRLQAEPA